MEVSLELFVRRGYAGATVRQIAAKAGISTGLMFHYFSSKQALLEEHIGVVEQGIHMVADRLGSAEASLATFKSVAEMILHSFEDRYSRNLFLLANQVLSLDSIPATVKRRVSATKSIRASVPVIVKGQRKGEIRRGDPLALAVPIGARSRALPRYWSGILMRQSPKLIWWFRFWPPADSEGRKGKGSISSSGYNGLL